MDKNNLVNTYVYSNNSVLDYTPEGNGTAYTNTIMTNSKNAILAGTPGNKETNHFITYDFKSDSKCGYVSYWKTNF
jgi:hypothetical protein